MKKAGIFILIICVSVIYSCKHQKLLKSTDLTHKYEMANKYYEKGQYYKAIPLLEELIPIYRGTQKAERLYYIYAYCDYNMRDYILAAHRFNTFVRTFPYSKYTEECQYMAAFCHFQLSPKYSLDQSDTYRAIEQLELFVKQYPHSDRVEKCHQHLDELRYKLEDKAFQIARQYYRTGRYKAATVALENVLIDFPDTRYRERIYLLMLKANYMWADNSVETKKHERFINTKKAYTKFASSFPESEYLDEAQEILEKTNKNLEQINE